MRGLFLEVIAALQAAGFWDDAFPARWAGLRDRGPLGLGPGWKGTPREGTRPSGKLTCRFWGWFGHYKKRIFRPLQKHGFFAVFEKRLKTLVSLNEYGPLVNSAFFDIAPKWVKNGLKKISCQTYRGLQIWNSLCHNRRMVNRNKNHDARCAMQDAGLGKEESPMFTGHLAQPFQCGVRSVECGMKSNSDSICRGGGAKFEYFRLKTDFRPMDDERWRRVSSFWARIPGKAPSRQTLPAQSMTIRSILKPGRNLAHYDPGLWREPCKLSGHATFYGREVGWSVFHPVDLWINPRRAAFVRVFIEGAKKFPITNDQGPRNDQCANPKLRGICLITSAATGCRFPSLVQVRT